MKQIILSLLTIGVFSCTKDQTPTLLGQWKLTGYYDCTGGGKITGNSPSLYFMKKGDFKIDTSNRYSIEYELKRFNKYLVRNDTIVFYKQNTNDSASYYYRLEDDLVLGFGYGGYVLSH